MARKLRVQYPGAVYHVLNRGYRREAIFPEDEDRRQFLATLGQACGQTGWLVPALCLMPNHFHPVIETPRASLAAGMKWLLGREGRKPPEMQNSRTDPFPEDEIINGSHFLHFFQRSEWS
jgi:REP element-mobilizing transposase RayT